MKSEWTESLKHIENALMRDFYHPLGQIAFEGFVTDQELRIEEAMKMPRQEIIEGEKWGEPWKYAWVFSKINLSKEAKGERIIMNLELGGEATLFVNGETFGTTRADWIARKHHYYVDQTLTECAKDSESYEVVCEVYGGHPMPRQQVGSCSTGPVFPEEESKIMEYKTATMGNNSYGIWHEEAYQLWLDIMVLREIMECGDQQSFRVEAIEQGIKRLIVAIDMEQPFDKRREIYNEMRTLLKPLMEAKNGSSAATFEAVANSHLDVAWMWDLAVTRRKTARTFAAQIRLLDEYPEMVFIQSQPILYEMCREHYPDVFEKIKEKVKSGQWIIDGAMWVEPDTNLSSGESLIRQFLYGKKYFKEVFDVDSRLCWLPDTFGYTAALPQIIKGCDVDYLTTQKIYWTYNDSERFPYHGFAWQGMDGSRINSYVHMQYESHVNPATIMKHWSNRMEKDGTGKFFLPFGYGDGGGGPTRDDVEQIRRTRDLEGTPKLNYTTPYQFMSNLEETSDVFERNVFNGELYFACHRGTYTTQANVKRDNRKTEIAMHETELWSALASWINKRPYDGEQIEASWKGVLLNQFHDILPGSSISKVYEDADKLYQEIYCDTDSLIQSALESFVESGEGYTYFNGTSFDREEYVLLPEEFANGARYLDGEEIPHCKTDEGLLGRVAVPAYGHVSLVPTESKTTEKQVLITALDNGGYKLENNRLIARIESNGTLSQVLSKTSNQSYIAGVGNQFHMYRDVPRKFDGWDIDVMTEQCEVEISDADVIIQQIMDSELEVALQVNRTIGDSKIQQIISLKADEEKIDFDTTIDWKELHKLLKVSFDTGIRADEAKNQIQFGFIERPTHRTRDCDADRFEVCNHFYTAIHDAYHGAAILNESKYGVSMLNDTLSLTLLKTGAHPEFRTDNHVHHFSYSYTFWNTPWSKSPVVKAAYAYNYPLQLQKGVTRTESYFKTSKDNIILETVKLAEDGSGDLILRYYEAKQGQTKCQISLSIPFSSVEECDMLEHASQPVAVAGNTFEVEFKPFEIKTLRVKI